MPAKSDEEVVAGIAGDHIVAAIADQLVVEQAARDVLDAGQRHDALAGILAARKVEVDLDPRDHAQHRVRDVGDDLARSAEGHRVGAGAAVEDVVAAVRLQEVVAAVAIEIIVGRDVVINAAEQRRPQPIAAAVSGQIVGECRARDMLDRGERVGAPAGALRDQDPEIDGDAGRRAEISGAVEPVAAVHGIDAGAAAQIIVVALAIELVVAGIAGHEIVAVAAMARVVVGAAEQCVDAGVAVQIVVPQPAVQEIVVVAAVQRVVAAKAAQLVVAAEAVDDVVAIGAEEDVVARAAIEEIGDQSARPRQAVRVAVQPFLGLGVDR